MALEALPLEVLLEVLSNLPLPCLGRVSLCSKRLSAAATHPSLPQWIDLDLYHCRSNVRDESVRGLWDGRVALTRFLSFSTCSNIGNPTLRKAAAALTSNLTSLSLFECCNATPEGVLALVRRCTSLGSLQLTNCVLIGDTTLLEVAKHLHSLHTLDLGGCTKITDKGLHHVVTSCPKLRELSLSNCVQVTDGSAESMRAAGLSLTRLRLKVRQHFLPSNIFDPLKLFPGQGTSITSHGFAGLALGCDLSSLELLDVSGCSFVTPEGLHSLTECCSTLRILDLSGCAKRAAVCRGISELIRGCPYLEIANLSILPHMSPCVRALAGCANLYKCVLAGCHDIVRADLIHLFEYCSTLEEIDLQGVRCVDDHTVNTLLRCCSRLKVIRLGQTKLLTDVSLAAIACSSTPLRFLALGQCYQITGSGVTVLKLRRPEIAVRFSEHRKAKKSDAGDFTPR